MMATPKINEKWALEQDELDMDNNAWRAKGPCDLWKDGGTLPGPAAPILFVFLMAVNNFFI